MIGEFLVKMTKAVSIPDTAFFILLRFRKA